MQTRELAKLVKETRHAKGLTIAGLAARSSGSLAPSYISRIENEQVKNGYVSNLVDLADALEIDRTEFLLTAALSPPDRKLDEICAKIARDVHGAMFWKMKAERDGEPK